MRTKDPGDGGNHPGAWTNLDERSDMDQRTCSVDGCEKRARGRGLCTTHWARWRKHGTTELPPKPSPTPCAVKECASVAAKRGWCNLHYKRWHRHGDPLGRASRVDPIARFWSNVHKGVGEDACWLWTAGTNVAGYGIATRTDGGSVLAHRWAYEQMVGPVPVGKVLDHFKCYTPSCVNPTHVRPETIRRNVENRAGESRNNTSGVRGVCWHKGAQKWTVQATARGVRHYGGLFTDLAEAEAAAVALRNRVMTNNLRDRD